MSLMAKHFYFKEVIVPKVLQILILIISGILLKLCYKWL